MTLAALALEFTNHCNLSCWFCHSQNPHISPPRPKGYMTPELLTKILSDVKEHYDASKIVAAVSYGGESMLHPKFREMLTATTAAGFYTVQLYTNGTQLNPEYIKLFEALKTRVYVSIHRHLWTEEVKQNAMQLKTAIKGNAGFNVLSEEWQPQEIRDLKDLAYKHGFLLQAGSGITENLHVISRVPNPSRRCRSMTYYLGVLWNGDCVPCCHLLNTQGLSIGNLNNQSVAEVFDGAAYNSLRNGDWMGKPCESCEIKV